MWRGTAAVKQHGQKARKAAACHTGGHHAQRVAQRKGQRPLGDKRCPHQQVLRRSAALCLSKPMREQQAGQRHTNGRHHTADHDCRHNVHLVTDQRQCAGQVGRFVDRPTVVGCHQRAQHDTHQQAAAAAHHIQHAVQPLVEPPQRRVDHQRHQRRNAQEAAQRRQKAAAHLLQVFGHFIAQPVQKAHQQPGRKPGDQRTPES